MIKDSKAKYKTSRAMLGILWAYLLTVLLCSPLHGLGVVTEVGVVLHIVLMLLAVMHYTPHLAHYVLLGFSLRVLVLCLDLYVPGITIVHSGMDTEAFYRWSAEPYARATLFTEGYSHGAYNIFMSTLFWLVGSSRLWAQYTNIVLGIITMLSIYGSMCTLGAGKQLRERTMWIATLFPMAIVFTSILLREAFVSCLVALSVQCMLSWGLRQGGFWATVGAVGSVLLASFFHSGVIGILPAYFMMFALYNPEKQALELSTQRLLYGAGILLIGLTGIAVGGQALLYKFNKLESVDDLTKMEANVRGASVYLQGLKISSWGTFVLYTPIRMVYFLFSPMPWDWRGPNDVVSSFLDSSLYAYCIYIACRCRHQLRQHPILWTMLLAIGFSTLIFSLGVENAGTAMRHRYKLFPLFLPLLLLGEHLYQMKSSKTLS